MSKKNANNTAKNAAKNTTNNTNNTDEKGHSRNALIEEQLLTSIVVMICICVNTAGHFISEYFSLPVWLDSFGTAFAAYSLGPICGAIVGMSSNIVFSFWTQTSLLYGLTSILIGISIGFACKHKYFETLFHAMTVAGVVTIISVVVSTSLNIVFYDGSTENLWGDGIRNYLITRNVPSALAAFVGQFYLEFADKLLTIVCLYFFIRLVRFIRKKLGTETPKVPEEAAKTAAALLLVFTAAATAGMFTPLAAYAETTEEASEPSYIRTIYNGDNGLACGHANDVIETNDGILWVGSYSGLYRYNGTTFRFMNEFDSVKNVNCLFVDTDGRLWIGTNDNGVAVSINEHIADSIDSKGGLPSDSVRCITQGRNGDYYIGTSDKMVVVQLRAGLVITDTIDDILYAKKVDSDKYGNIATVTAAGKLYILKDKKIAYEITESDITGYTTCSFSESGELYAGTADGKVITYEISDSKAKKTSFTECEGLNGINRIYMQNEHVAWVLSDNGVGTLTDKKTYEHMETEGFNYSLENITIDYQDNLWIASSRMGLMQLSPAPITDVFGDYGLEAGVVNTTKLHDGKLYIGTDNGLVILDTEKKTEVTSELTELLAESRVRCIKSDSKGNLWLCSYGKGLVELTASGSVKEFDGDEYGMGSRVRVCLELKDGSIAVGGDKGLYFIKDEKITKTLIYGEDMGAAKVLCLLETDDGRLLAGTDGNGVTVIKNGKVEGEYTRDMGLTSGVILRLVQDTDGASVFAVTGNSICYIKDEVIRELNNFNYYNNYDIVLDDDGDMFISGSAGVYVVNRSELLSGKSPDSIVLNSKVGLRGSLTSNAWNDIDDDKNMYLSTDRGVFSVNMDSYKTKKRFFRLMVSEMWLDGTSMPIKRGSGTTISKDVKTVEFVPEVVNYTLENPNISYCMEGLDTDWKTVPQKDLSHIVYTNLPSGDYRFRLAVIDPDTNQILRESTYSFRKEMAIYDNTWFKVYMIAIAILFVGWLTWFFTRTQAEHTMEIQKAKLALALQQVQMGNETILAIAKTVDAKDLRTSRHSQRVSDYSVMIANKYGFTKEEQENLRKAALLHDIGKIGIPDAILNKPARLTDEEYAIMKTHVTLGAEILKDFTLVDHVVDGARYHHERYDGRGYPDNLKGKDIPLYGRIIAVADAFDAMTANRVYRKRQDMDYVMDELHKGRGTQFDPELLDIFLGLIDSGEIDIDKLYSDNNPEEKDGEVDKNGK